ncbi:ribonuclease BN [Roseivivax halodurans JCM 10272]|uniref:Ribonuclease BN n=1 Tax=Roseivivax halodurans JCM 10272 TaxID=1449350 RepID=X7EFL5_9RHOB|nr:YihY/virulence factor BrkB family protein [Roseivivax halodurans]ETX14675.1 ribonuclease BN [Roseivivax halodurans JCM 10272]
MSDATDSATTDKTKTRGAGHGSLKAIDVTRPRHIPPGRWWRILLRVGQHATEHNTSVIAAGVAFYTLLSIFPAFTAFISLAGYVLDPSDLTDQLEQLVGLLPQEAAMIIRDQVLEVTGGDSTATGIAAILALTLALYGSVRGVKTLMAGMNIAYGEREKRNIIMLNLVAIVLMIVLIVGVAIALNAVIVIPVVMDFVGLSSGLDIFLRLLKWIILFGMVVFGLSLLYRFAPSRRKAKWRWVSPGALVAAILWMIGTIGFSVYVQNFGSYNETYGTLGGVIILLTWLWLSAFIVLLGAEFNAEIEHHTTADTTAGRDRPMGQRGAVKADTVPDGSVDTSRSGPAD